VNIRYRSSLFKSYYRLFKEDATEYMVIIYLLRIIYENEESIYDFDSCTDEHKISRVC
jgi:5-bromo-4-chloroindolyl phosphate hydrolysis protein